MIYLEDGYVVDVDLSLVLSVARMLDGKMEAIISRASDSEQVDSSGVLVELEHLLGFGVVGFQTYITDMASFAGLAKHDSFGYGQKMATGTSKIQIINAVANYWKHRSEWALGGGGKRQKAVNDLFQEIGYSTDIDYPVSGVLTELLTPLETRLCNLADIMISWRNSLFSDPSVRFRLTTREASAVE